MTGFLFLAFNFQKNKRGANVIFLETANVPSVALPSNFLENNN
jgi:hypothetical protein